MSAQALGQLTFNRESLGIDGGHGQYLCGDGGGKDSKSEAEQSNDAMSRPGEERNRGAQGVGILSEATT